MRSSPLGRGVRRRGVTFFSAAAMAGAGIAMSAQGADPDVATNQLKTAMPIKHVIFLVKENRTFDNYFGKFPGANGATTGRTSDGGTVPLGPMPDITGPDFRNVANQIVAIESRTA